MGRFVKGDLVRIKSDLHTIEDFAGGYVDDMKEYEGRIYKVKNILVYGYELENCAYVWDERALEYPNNIKEDKVDKIKNVSFDEVKLTRKELRDTITEVAMEFITNPPEELKDDKSPFLLALLTPIIGDMVADKLFGKEEKKEDE